MTLLSHQLFDHCGISLEASEPRDEEISAPQINPGSGLPLIKNSSVDIGGYIIGDGPLNHDDEAVIAAALSAATYLPLVLLFGGVAYILDGLSVAFAAGSALIAMVSAGAMMTVMVALGVDATGLHLALYGLGAFMVGRVMAGTLWSLRFLGAEKSV